MIDTVHIVVAMKPIEDSFADNALKHGVAGINIDGCRVGYISKSDESESKEKQSVGRGGFHGERTGLYGTGKEIGYVKSLLVIVNPYKIKPL